MKIKFHFILLGLLSIIYVNANPVFLNLVEETTTIENFSTSKPELLTDASNNEEEISIRGKLNNNDIISSENLKDSKVQEQDDEQNKSVKLTKETREINEASITLEKSEPFEVNGKVNSDEINAQALINDLEELQLLDALNNSRVVSENITSINGINPCESRADFSYFKSFPNNTKKYIMCDSWGTMQIRECFNDYIWDSWQLRCELPENVKNMSLIWAENSNSTIQIVDCLSANLTCLNNAVCINSFGINRCLCNSNFTGEFCESPVDNYDLYHEIISGKFSIKEYIQRLSAENLTFNITFYERYKDKLDVEIYDELINYLKFFEKKPIRYDLLTNNLVEELLENIYPDAYFLMSFNSSSYNVVDLVRLIPNLLSYARYSVVRYQEVFAQYQKVLQLLAENLNASFPDIKDDANRYYRLTNIFLNRTMVLLNESESIPQAEKEVLSSSQAIPNQPVKMSEEELKSKLQNEFNATYTSSNHLFDSLNKFQNKVIKEMQTNTKIFNLTIEASNFVGSKETARLLSEISQDATQIWESLVNYGFWFITNKLIDSSSRESINFKIPNDANF